MKAIQDNLVESPLFLLFLSEYNRQTDTTSTNDLNKKKKGNTPSVSATGSVNSGRG